MTKISRRDTLKIAGASLVAASFVPAAASAEGKFPKPPAGKGQVIFYRSGSGAGNSVRFTIQDKSGKTVAELKRGAVNVVPVSPGPNFFRVPEANNTEGTIDVKAGQTIFVRCFLNAATFTGKLQFEEVTAERAAQELGL